MSRMSPQVKVFKFGGASLKDAEGIRNVGRIISSYTNDNQLVVVVSAIGKTTNALEDVVDAHASGSGEAMERLNTVRDAHLSLASDLLPDHHPAFPELNDAFVEIEWVLEESPYDNYDYMYDQIVSIGEVVSSLLVAAYLETIGIPAKWLDARDVIITDNHFREGWVLWPQTRERMERTVRPLIQSGGVLLTQGFIGSTTENFTTTLGREGSDYTAAIFSFCLDAEDMTIWKDVPGVLTADPRLFENVSKLDKLSYREAIEMTYYGAKVIHPKTIKPLQNKSIPLHVKSFLHPSEPGTIISSDVEDHYPPMVAIESSQALLHIATRDFSFVAEHHLSQLFQKMADLRLQVNMMQNNAISFAVVVTDFAGRVDEFVQSIDHDFKVLIDRDLELITIRHALDSVLDELKKGRIILLEERSRNTIQMVVKEAPVITRKPR